MAYQNQIDRFDIERGDVLSFAREDVARLAEYWEYSHPVLRNLFRWFLGDDEAAVQMQDPRDNRELRGLIEHQKKNAERRYDYLVAQRERKLGKGKNHGQPRTTTDDQVKEQYKHKPKNSVSVDSSVLCGGDAATTDGLPPSASPSSSTHGTGIGKEDIIEARKVLARYAPAPKFVLAFNPKNNDGGYTAADDNDDHNIDDRAKRSMDKVKACYLEDGCEWNEEDCWWQVSRSMYLYYGKDWDEDGTARSFIGDAYNDSLRAAWRKYHDTLGDTTFINAIWSFHIAVWTDNIPANDKDGNKTDKGKLLFGRLKKLVEAKAILDQYDDHRRTK